MRVSKHTVIKLMRDIALILLVILVVSKCQERHLLDTDGSEHVPQYNLMTLEDTIQPLPAPGQRTLIYFFAPWCSVCALSINNLDGIDDEHLVVLRVALDYEDEADVRRFVSQNQVKGTVMMGNQAVRDAFQVRGYPSYYIVDETNKVVARSFGYSTSLGMKINNFLNRG